MPSGLSFQPKNVRLAFGRKHYSGGRTFLAVLCLEETGDLRHLAEVILSIRSGPGHHVGTPFAIYPPSANPDRQGKRRWTFAYPNPPAAGAPSSICF